MKEINGFKIPVANEKYYELCVDGFGNWIASSNHRSIFADRYYYARAADKAVFVTEEEAQKEADSRNKRIDKDLKPKRWRPAVTNRFYFINAQGSVDWSLFYEIPWDNCWQIGNCFETEAEALKVAAKFKTWLLAETEPK